MKQVNVHIYPSPFKNESRMLKITKTLADNNVFDKIYIIATRESGLPERESIDDVREVVRIHGRSLEVKQGNFRKIIKTLQWSWNICMFLRKKKANCINCHSLQVLPLCVFLKIVKSAKLIYDTHELETETASSNGIRKYISKIVEKILIKFVDETIVVNDFIADWYQKKYKLEKVGVVKNVPYTQNGYIKRTTILSDIFKIPQDDVLFLYQGLIGYGRGIELLLKIFSKLNTSKHIILMGYGELVEKVIEHAKVYPNIHYLKAVKPDEVVYYTSSADIGISLIENVCLSYYLCLPNKMFEYVCCKVPVIVSDFPGMAKFIDEYNCGWKCTPTVEDAARLIEQITFDALSEKRNGAIEARKHFGWHLEEPTLLNVYKKLGF